MFTFILLNILDIFNNKKNKTLDPFFNYRPPTANEIRKMTEKLSRCPYCQFLIFDNYWSDDIENTSAKVCPTCGVKLEN